MTESSAKTNRQIHQENLRSATKVARNSLLILVALTIIKAAGGYFTKILPLIGDAIGSFSDIIAMSAIFIGLKLSQKKANSTFKYGYHRIETFVSLCISIFIIYAGSKIFVESIDRFFHEAPTEFHALGIITSLISIAVSLFSFFYQSTIAKKINSTALQASAYDKRNDAFVSLGVLLSVIADKFNVPYVEGIVGVGLSLLIIFTGINYGKDALLYLLDHWDDPELTEKIRAIVKKSKIVTAVKNIRLRRVGTYIFGEVFLEINPFTDSKDLRDEIHRLDHEVESNVEHLGDIVLYINPPKPTRVRVAIPVIKESGLASEIAENPAEEFSFLFIDIKQGEIKNFFSRSDKFRWELSASGNAQAGASGASEAGASAKIATFLKSQEVNILISSLIHPLLYYHLRLNNIKVYPHFLGVKDVAKTVKLLLLDI